MRNMAYFFPQACYLEGSMRKIFTDLASSVRSCGWEEGYDDFMMNRQTEETCLLDNGGFSEFRQGSWALLLGDIQNKKILNIEGSFGASSLTLARMGADVIALQRSGTFGRAFASRVRTNASENIHVVVGDVEEEFPFKKGSFDIVCIHNLNLVSQLFNREIFDSVTLFKHLSELVKANGYLYFSGLKQSIHDKWNWKNNNIFSRMVHALFKAGWRIDIIFDFYQDIFNPYIIRTFYPIQSGVSIIEAIKTFLTSRNFGLIASPKRSNSTKIGVGGVFTRLNAKGLVAKSINNKLYLGSRSVIRLFTKDRLIRLPLSDLGIASCQANRNALKIMEKYDVPFLVPRAMEHALSPIPFFCEERLSGVAINEDGLSQQVSFHYLEQGINFLDLTYKIKNEMKTLGEKEYDLYIGNILKFVKEWVDDERKYAIEKIDSGLKKKYLGIDLPIVFGHGDYKISNFIIDSKKNVIGVVDWDRFNEESPIMIDSILLLSHNDSRQRNVNWVHSILSMPFDESSSRLIHDHMVRNNVDPELIQFYIMLSSLHIIKYNGPLSISYPSWQRECITPVIQYIVKMLKGQVS